MNNITNEIAEIAGFFAADGSMQKNHICFWGNPSEDRDYYDFHLKNLFYKAFKIEINPHDKFSNSVYGFYICNKEIINYFQEHLNFFPGSKTYIVEIPEKILKNNNSSIKSSFINGLFAGDGSLSFMKRYSTNYNMFLQKYHCYPRIQIQLASKNIIYQMSKILIDLGIPNFINERLGKRKNQADTYVLNVYGKKRLKKWVKIIGFSNNNHMTRFKIFKKFGFVPPKTTYTERVNIINNQQNPYLNYSNRGQ
jgi:DNA-binding transcriptional regulator WhiA